MNIGWKPLALSAAVLLLLVCIPTTLGAIALFLLMTPMVVLFTMLKPAAFAAYIVPVAAIAYLLLGGFGTIALMVGLFFLVPAMVMGWLYKKEKPARTVLLAGFGVLLAEFLLELVVLSQQFQVDWASELSAMLKTGLDTLQTDVALPPDWAQQTADTLGRAIVTMLPTLLLLSSFLFAAVTHALSRRLLAWAGIAAPSLPPMRTWLMPRSLVLYYFAALLLSYVLPASGSGFWGVVAANLVPVLRFAFTIQAIAFFFFLTDVKRWPRAVPFVVSVPILLFPPLYLIGLLDVAFPLRRYFVKP